MQNICFLCSYIGIPATVNHTFNVTKYCYRYNKGIEEDYIYLCHDSNEIGIVSSHVSDKKKRGFHNKQLKQTRISQCLPAYIYMLPVTN